MSSAIFILNKPRCLGGGSNDDHDGAERANRANYEDFKIDSKEVTLEESFNVFRKEIEYTVKHPLFVDRPVSKDQMIATLKTIQHSLGASAKGAKICYMYRLYYKGSLTFANGLSAAKYRFTVHSDGDNNSKANCVRSDCKIVEHIEREVENEARYTYKVAREVNIVSIPNTCFNNKQIVSYYFITSDNMRHLIGYDVNSGKLFYAIEFEMSAELERAEDRLRAKAALQEQLAIAFDGVYKVLS